MAANHVESQELSTLKIRDRTLTKGVHAVFSPKNNFLIYGVQRGESHEVWDSQYLHEISSRVPLFNKHVRKLVNESQGIFLSLNASVQDNNDRKRNTEILKISQKYRSVLLACIEDLEYSEETNDDELLELKDMFADIELIWHLLQSLIIDCHSGSKVLYQLLEWIKWHFLLAEKRMEGITSSEELSSHPEFWDTVIQFVLQGKMLSARALLELHPEFKNEEFASLDELLRTMPMYLSTSKMSLNEFRIRWRHWQDECKGRLFRGEFATDSNLETICKILCGDGDTLTEKSYLCCNWYHLMISVQLYTDPTINLTDLGNVARLFYSNMNTSEWNKPTLIDSIILAAMELDIMTVINLSCTFNDGWWFALHMMDLLMHGNYIDQDLQQNCPHPCRSNILMNYAEALMSHNSLWEIGISYLDQCPENNRELIEQYLERIPLRTEAKARKIIHIAKQRNLDSLIKTISNVMTSKALANGMLGTAISWVMYSKDVKFADELADRWMKDYALKRKFECFEILHNLGSCMLVSDKLTFVGKYCEFHKLHSEKEYRKAASLLLSLISSGIAAPDFQVIMLLDALPLLESSELIFSSKETHQLMRCLEETVSSSGHKRNEPHKSDDKESLIRLALIRNLARSFILEPSMMASENGF